MRTIAIGGEPATGKSTIMRRVLELLGPGSPFAHGLCRFTLHSSVAGHPVSVLGMYEGEGFPGTDRLSMGVQPHAVSYLRSLSGPATVVFEGDRLFNGKFLTAAKGCGPLEVYVIETDPALLSMRHALARADTQSETWLAGRRTKVANIKRDFKHVVLHNDLPSDVETLAQFLAGRVLA